MISQKIKGKLMVVGVVILCAVVFPTAVFSSHRKDLYVDKSAADDGDGSSSHPYKTIKKAIDKADGKTDIHVSNGEYEENFTLKEDIRLYGEDADDTIIKADSGNSSVVDMEDNTEINGFTIKRGKNGIRVEDDAEVSIIDCVIKFNDNDGIYIEGSDTRKTRAVYISEIKSRDNGKSGIYSAGARRVVIMDSQIFNNSSDGIDLAAGISAWIENNTINNNGSGMKLTIDRSNIWTKGNSIRKNNREGIEVSFYGTAGRINLSRTKIVDNGSHGIAKLHRTNAATNLWNSYLTFDAKPINKMQYWGNGRGDISNIIFVK